MIEYPNYCVVTPCGIFNKIKHKDAFDLWYKPKVKNLLPIVDSDIENFPLNKKTLSKIGYDRKNDCLNVKIKSNMFYLWFRDIFNNNHNNNNNNNNNMKYSSTETNGLIKIGIKNKRRIWKYWPKCRYINAVIIDQRLILNDDIKKIRYRLKCGKANKNDLHNKYMQILSKWKGFIKVAFDITHIFDSFQETLKFNYKLKAEKLIGRSLNENEFEWNNRKYYMPSKKMPYLTWNKESNRLFYSDYLRLDDNRVFSHDKKYNFFCDLDENCHGGVGGHGILENIFSFLNKNEYATVCLDWDLHSFL